jgi:hypothetical protein
LVGNLSLAYGAEGGTVNAETWDLDTGSTTYMQATGLMACSDIQASPWRNAPFSPFKDSAYNAELFANTFPVEPWMCRNGTFLRAIEDLANNITISYLSSADLTNDNTIFKDIPTSDTRNVYVYHPLYLFLSYGLALLFTSVAACIGFYSLFVNGVTHSMSFSAIVATTRNPDLDSLSRGSSLGTVPLNTNIEKVELRFGPLLNSNTGLGNEGYEHEMGDGVVPHLAFGFEHSVGHVKKGALYI